MSFVQFGNFDFIVGRKNQIYIALLVFLGFWDLYYCILSFLYKKIDNLQICAFSANKLIGKKIDTDFFKLSFELLFIFWIAFGFMFYPGSVPHDMRYQLLQFNRIYSFSTQHPIPSTLVFGSLFKIGEFLLGNFGGIRFIVFLQTLLGAYAFAKICTFVKEKTNLFCGIIVFCYFAFVPVFWAYMQAAIKDTFYIIFFSLFVLSLFKCLIEKCSKKELLLMLITAIFSSFFRHDAVFIIIPSLIPLLFLHPNKKKILGVILIFSLFTVSVNFALSKKFSKYSNPAYLGTRSIQIQQIARYVKYYGDTLSDEEKKVIDDILFIKTLGTRYNPEISDPVTFTHRDLSKLTTPQWKAFNALWVKLLMRHPRCYFEATLNNIYGYIFPYYYYYDIASLQFYNKEFLSNNDKGIVYSEYLFSESVRKIASESAYIWNNFPLISFCTNPAFPTVLGIFLISCLFAKRKFKYLVFFVAPFMNVLICFASPVNGCLRYMLSVMCALPLYILVGILPCIKNTEGKFQI